MGHPGGGCSTHRRRFRRRAKETASKRSQPIQVTPLAIHNDRLVKTTREHAKARPTPLCARHYV